MTLRVRQNLTEKVARDGYKNAYEIQKAHNMRAERKCVEREGAAFVAGADWRTRDDTMMQASGKLYMGYRGDAKAESARRYPLPEEGA